MIITIEDAKKIHEGIEQYDLDSFETTIREITNNNFQLINIRCHKVSISETGLIEVRNGSTKGMFAGDTVEINHSEYNNGLFVIKSLEDDSITVNIEDKQLVAEINDEVIVTKVKYPADVINGVRKLIQYDAKMGDKIGIKSQSVSRVSTTYYDVNSSENIDGYPSSLMSFLNKYRKMRWT